MSEQGGYWRMLLFDPANTEATIQQTLVLFIVCNRDLDGILKDLDRRAGFERWEHGVCERVDRNKYEG